MRLPHLPVHAKLLNRKQQRNEGDLEDVIEDWAELRPVGSREDDVAYLPYRWRNVAGMHGDYLMEQ